MQNSFIVPKLYFWISQKMHKSSKIFYVNYFGNYTVSLLPTKGHSKNVSVVISSPTNGATTTLCEDLTAAYEYAKWRMSVAYHSWTMQPQMFLSEAYSQNKMSVNNKINERSLCEHTAISYYSSLGVQNTWTKRKFRNLPKYA